VGRFYWDSKIVITGVRMLKTILLIGCISALVCWAIGAYNRLVRLRSAANIARNVWQTTEDSRRSVLLIQGVQDESLNIEQQDKEQQTQMKSRLAKEAFASATGQYNQAIKQFPASLLASLFAFKPLIQSEDNTI
jgi:hypothetical protein